MPSFEVKPSHLFLFGGDGFFCPVNPSYFRLCFMFFEAFLEFPRNEFRTLLRDLEDYRKVALGAGGKPGSCAEWGVEALADNRRMG